METTSIKIATYYNLNKNNFIHSFKSAPVFHWLYHIIRLTISLIFIWSGISKLLDPVSFNVIIEAYGLVPDLATMPIAICLSLAELIAGIGLFLDIRGSLASVTLLLLLFIFILSYGLWIGLDIDCGCFGPEDPESKAFHSLSSALFKDLVLILGIIYLYFFRYIKTLIPHTVSRVFNKIKLTRRKNK